MKTAKDYCSATLSLSVSLFWRVLDLNFIIWTLKRKCM